MNKKEITKNKNLKMSLALVAIGVLMVIGCPASSNGGPDTTAPTLMDSNPSADSTSFSADANITLTYSESVLAGTGNITITSSGGNAITIAVTDTAQVSIAGAVVTIDPTDNLELSTTYVLTIPAGAFMDAAGNKTAEDTVDFSTAATLDTTAPTLSSSVPAADATDINTSLNIILTYNEPVQAGTGNITIVPSSGGTTLTIPVGDAQVTIAGRVVTINPTNNLVMSTTYTLTVPAGAIVDASGNAGLVVTLSFSTAAALDTTAPTLQNTNPSADSTSFSADANITLTYSEAVQAGTGDITFTLSNAIALTIPVGDAQVTIAGRVVTIDPTANLELSSGYVLTIPAGAFMDAAGNKTAEDTVAFTTAVALDTTAPMLSASVPTVGVMDFLVGENIVLTYNEAVQAGTGNITLSLRPSGEDAITIAVTDAQVSFSGAVVTINPSEDLELSTMYTLTVPAGAIVDASGNEWPGVTRFFTTAAAADTTLPTIESIVPAQNGKPIVSADIVLTYSEAVQRGTGSITIAPTSGSGAILIPVADTVQVTIADNVVTINPTNDLVASTMYTLTVSAGGFTDTSGNSTVEFTLSFMTLDTTSPTFSSSVPAANATGFNASSNIVLTYSEPVQAGTGDITLTPSGGAAITIAVGDAQVSIAGAVVTINPTADLVVSTTYALAVPAGAIQDLADNSAAILDLSFSTAAVINPVLISSVPVSGETGFSIDKNIVLTFSEGVAGPSVGRNLTITPMGGGTPITIPLSDAQVSRSGAVVTINPTANLELNTQYDLTIPANGFVYDSGNTNAEITLSFTTAALLVPRVISSVPAEGGTIAPTAGIMLTYNEPIVKGSGNIMLATSQSAATIAVSDEKVSISGNVVSIDISELSFNVFLSYALGLTVPAAAFANADGNNPLRDYVLNIRVRR